MLNSRLNHALKLYLYQTTTLLSQTSPNYPPPIDLKRITKIKEPKNKRRKEKMPTPLNIGVLLFPNTQLLDLSCIDLLSMTNPTYLSACNLPPTLIHLGHTTQIHYIGLGAPGTLTPLTSNINLQLTASLTDDTFVGPGHLNALLIPGPDPNVVPDTPYLDFIRRHHAHGTQILAVCTGSFVLGHAGILSGRVCTGPRLLVPLLRDRFPEAKEWVQSVRVVRDGNVWTSGLYFSSSFPLIFFPLLPKIIIFHCITYTHPVKAPSQTATISSSNTSTRSPLRPSSMPSPSWLICRLDRSNMILLLRVI